MAVGTGLSSCTKDIKWTRLAPRDETGSMAKYSLYIADTPGFSCSDRTITDPQIIKKILDSVREK